MYLSLWYLRISEYRKSNDYILKCLRACQKDNDEVTERIYIKFLYK